MKLLLAAAMPPRPSFNTWKSVRDGGRRKAHFGGNFTSEHFLFIYFRGEFWSFCEKILGNGNILLQILSFLNRKYSPKTDIFTLKSPNFATVAYHMKKGCLRFSIFIFLISPNLAKCVFFRISRLEQHHKIENKK